MLLFCSFRSCQPIHMSSPASCRRISSRRLRTCTESAVFLNSSQLLLSASCHLQSYSAKATFFRTHAQQSSCVSAFGLSMQHFGTKSLPNTQDPFAAAMHSADLMFSVSSLLQYISTRFCGFQFSFIGSVRIVLLPCKYASSSAVASVPP